MKHIFSLLLTLSLCACSAVGPGGGSTDDTTTPDTTTPPAPETTTPPETCPPAVTEIRPDDETYVTWYGRTANGAAGRVYFDYTASGFTVCFRGSKLELTFAATEWNNEKARPYITVITDGEDYLSAPVYALDKSTQTITLEHQAHSRSLFAEGALTAAAYLVEQPAGLYDMQRMIED